MSIKPTLTLGICLAAGLAFGIGLARPGDDSETTGTATGSGEQAAAPAAGGYGGSQADQPAPAGNGAEAPAAPAALTIADFAYGAPLTVAPGATVTVTNADSAPHTVTADDGSFDTGSVANGAVSTITAPTAPGTYEFFCTIHPSMKGTITVQG